MDAAWTRTSQEILSHFSVDHEQGLTLSQVENHAELYGKNELPEDPPTPLLELILEQFKDQLVLILLGSAVVSFILALVELREPGNDSSLFTAFVEPSVILLILIANATVGVIQETSAEKAIDALKEYSPDIATVIRDGQLQKINASALVPGDIISVSVGDQIPADCRLLSISSSSFRIDQAILTGESIGVHKSINVVKDSQAVKQDQTNLLFSGTTVVNGTARAVVVATGSKTAIGDIHHSISLASQIGEKTPLKKKLDDFGDMLAKVISVICLLVWIVNIRHFSDPSHGGSFINGALYYLKIAVALAVAAIPEGLAAVITACLALGTKKMAKHGAIVRSLPSVETLGSTNVVCSDKTGTLTSGQMSVSRFLVIEGSSSSPQPVDYFVEGSTFSPSGKITKGSSSGLPIEPSAQNPALTRLAEISALCNDASIQYHHDKNSYSALGEPTEAALKVLVEKIGATDTKVTASLASLPASKRTSALSDYHLTQLERLLTFEFSRDRKMMSVLVNRRSAKQGHLFVKGAPEAVLERCSTVLLGSNPSSSTVVPLTPSLRASLLATATQTYGTDSGLRTLALAYRDVSSTNANDYTSESTTDYARFEKDLTFVSLVGMLDPPRPEVRKAVDTLRNAGIRVVVITGDNQGTAESVCRQIGIFDDGEDGDGDDEGYVEKMLANGNGNGAANGKANGNGNGSAVGKRKPKWSYTGKEFDALDREGKIEAVKYGRLFSRTEPGHKSQLVDLMQELGMVVAMTGDGVNDAPALKKADIGIAMGSGTDVAKHAADMVLADSNFATIEVAVEEGRLIYANTKQFIRYLISSNIGEVVSIFLTVVLGMPEALIPVQLLWVNLVTDSLPATALGFNPADHSLMKEPPRDSREPLVGKWLFFRYMVIGTYVGVATVAGYAWWFMFYAGGPQISFYQLTHFHQCSTLFPSIGCEMFTNELAKRATTMSLSILVTVEMFNAMNSLSENESLLRLPLWKNMFLVGAIALSMALHFLILYVPFLADLFVIAPLNWDEWMGVLALSFPVIVIDEILKFISATVIAPHRKIKTA